MSFSPKVWCLTIRGTDWPAQLIEMVSNVLFRANPGSNFLIALKLACNLFRPMWNMPRFRYFFSLSRNENMRTTEIPQFAGMIRLITVQKLTMRTSSWRCKFGISTPYIHWNKNQSVTLLVMELNLYSLHL